MCISQRSPTSSAHLLKDVVVSSIMKKKKEQQPFDHHQAQRLVHKQTGGGIRQLPGHAWTHVVTHTKHTVVFQWPSQWQPPKEEWQGHKNVHPCPRASNLARQHNRNRTTTLATWFTFSLSPPSLFPSFPTHHQQCMREREREGGLSKGWMPPHLIKRRHWHSSQLSIFSPPPFVRLSYFSTPPPTLWILLSQVRMHIWWGVHGLK